MKPRVTKELLFAYFAGQATPFQKQLIEEWGRQAENQEAFFAWLQDYESMHPQYLADVETALEHHRGRMQALSNQDLVTPAPQIRSLPTNRPWLGWLVAASIGVALVGGWVLRDDLLRQTYRTGYGEVRSLVLADGSHVTLNANSTLRVSRFGFGHQTRDVLLTGEATFSVTHTPDDEPFIVRTDKSFEVVVLGTEFVVYNRHQGGRVVLNRGKVQLRYKLGETTRQLTMQPGDQATVNPQGQPQLRQLAKPENTMAWRDSHYVFDATPLTDVARLFEDTYGWQLKFADSTIANWTVSGSFTAQNADELLEPLMHASGLTYTKRANQILITNPAN